MSGLIDDVIIDVILDGEGAYEGLTFAADYDTGSDTFHGYIIAGGLPPAPQNASPG